MREFGPCGASEWRTSMSIAFLRFCSVLHLALHRLEGYLVYTNICFYGIQPKSEIVANTLCAAGCGFHCIVGSDVVFMLLFSCLPALPQLQILWIHCERSAEERYLLIQWIQLIVAFISVLTAFDFMQFIWINLLRAPQRSRGLTPSRQPGGRLWNPHT